ncbi:MAG: tetratricopeptide repeat protein [Deltaproteobacteria bacterium]|nr:tetratricopeptide repeat protein [Deltaproteobacteria bacterium]
MTKVRRTLRAAASGAVIMLVLAGCRPEGATDSPDGPREKVDLDGLEANATPSADAGTPAAPAAAADKAKGLPKTRDRDPEEEKKKLALSHQRSAEAQKHLEAGRLVEAIDHSRQALRIHEQNVEAMLVMAEAYFRQKKFELVQAVTSSALAVDEKVRTPQESSRAHNLKGFAYTAMGQDNLATQAFRKAAEADDKNAAAWNNLGTRYMQAGDIATAKQCFAYALELDPRFAKAHLNFGAALRAEGKWQDAEKSFDTALKLRPNYPEAYFDLGVLYLDADPYPGLETVGRLEKAIAFLTKYRELAIADGPEGPSPTNSKGRGPKVAPGPAPVSKARAEDYIRVAKKGIEREQRRIDREKARGEKKPEAAGGGGTDATPASGDGPTPAKPGGAAKPAGPGDPPSPPGAGRSRHTARTVAPDIEADPEQAGRRGCTHAEQAGRIVADSVRADTKGSAAGPAEARWGRTVRPGSEVADPRAARPDAAGSEVTDPRAADPRAADPEAARTGAAGTEVTDPTVGRRRPDAAAPEPTCCEAECTHVTADGTEQAHRAEAGWRRDAAIDAEPRRRAGAPAMRCSARGEPAAVRVHSPPRRRCFRRACVRGVVPTPRSPAVVRTRARDGDRCVRPSLVDAAERRAVTRAHEPHSDRARQEG